MPATQQMILLLITILLFTVYAILILYYYFCWKKIPVYSPGIRQPTTKISVIIAARNEEKNIGHLLQSLQQQSYPASLFEVIVVDDHSSDNTAAIVQQSQHVRLLQLKEDGLHAYKKKAIETGIRNATGELIVTTDADCFTPSQWLSQLAAFKEATGAVFIAAPVAMEYNHSLLQRFQSIDFLTLQGITGVAVHRHLYPMCNGANLAYERTVFFEVDGFAGIDDIASGDDMLLLQKIWRKYPDRIHYLKSPGAVISTQPATTVQLFFQQRIRWASKATRYKNNLIFLVLLLVYLFNCCFPVLLIAGFFDPFYWIIFLGGWVAKTIIELPFVYSVSVFFKKTSLLKIFFFLQPLHFFYTVVAGLLGQTASYEWKGRLTK